ncbi:DUF4190 domain-containing protein [Micromonospora sp. CPCC 205561]|uniref:DUF4190 domain-containing protein n=1 Tax=Micromonospora sp. CPCC 205561 TaxID=3122407 RepID=UPI002FF1453A
MTQPPPPGPPDPDRPLSPWEPPPEHGPSRPEPFPYGQPGEPPPGQQWGHQPPYTPQVPYGQYGPPSGHRPAGGTNVLAILSLVFAFVFSPAGIVLGHLAKRQIRTTGEEGDQLATWGLVLGYAITGLGVLACCGWIALIAVAGNNGPNY